MGISALFLHFPLIFTRNTVFTPAPKCIPGMSLAYGPAPSHGRVGLTLTVVHWTSSILIINHMRRNAHLQSWGVSVTRHQELQEFVRENERSGIRVTYTGNNDSINLERGETIKATTDPTNSIPIMKSYTNICQSNKTPEQSRPAYRKRFRPLHVVPSECAASSTTANRYWRAIFISESRSAIWP